jgi:hypothetical protein
MPMDQDVKKQKLHVGITLLKVLVLVLMPLLMENVIGIIQEVV